MKVSSSLTQLIYHARTHIYTQSQLDRQSNHSTPSAFTYTHALGILHLQGCYNRHCIGPGMSAKKMHCNIIIMVAMRCYVFLCVNMHVYISAINIIALKCFDLCSSVNNYPQQKSVLLFTFDVPLHNNT